MKVIDLLIELNKIENKNLEVVIDCSNPDMDYFKLVSVVNAQEIFYEVSDDHTLVFMLTGREYEDESEHKDDTILN